MHADRVIEEGLQLDERLLWSGRPPQGFLWRLSDWLLVPFSFVFALFAGFWEVSAATIMTQPLPVIVLANSLGAIMCAAGAYLAIGRFIVDLAQRRATRYAVTSQRIIISRTWPMNRVQSFKLAALSDVRLNQTFGDIGTIVFPGGNEALFYLMGGNESWPWASLAAPPRFERIHDARAVFELIESARRAAARG